MGGQRAGQQASFAKSQDGKKLSVLFRVFSTRIIVLHYRALSEVHRARIEWHIIKHDMAHHPD